MIDLNLLKRLHWRQSRHLICFLKLFRLKKLVLLLSFTASIFVVSHALSLLFVLIELFLPEMEDLLNFLKLV